MHVHNGPVTGTGSGGTHTDLRDVAFAAWPTVARQRLRVSICAPASTRPVRGLQHSAAGVLHWGGHQEWALHGVPGQSPHAPAEHMEWFWRGTVSGTRPPSAQCRPPCTWTPQLTTPENRKGA